MPVFTDEELTKFVQTSNFIPDKGLDKAIKIVWGDLDAKEKQRRADSTIILLQSIGQLRHSQNELKKVIDNLASENRQLNQRMAKTESELSKLIQGLSQSKKLKKLIE